MKRKLLAFTMTLALILTALSATGANAHFVDIESKSAKNPSRGDWFGVQATGIGSVVTQRNSAQQGEVVFNDATGDQRWITASTDVTRSVDLDWFSVTADANNLYFLAKVERYQGIAQTPPIELMISIDTDHANNSGTLALPGTAGISVTNDAAWEFVVDTKFSTGAVGVAPGSTTIFATGGSASGSSCGTSCAAQLASSAISQGSFAEIAVPWSKLTFGNLSAKPALNSANFLRFTVSTYYNKNPRPTPLEGNTSVNAMDILDRSTSQTATVNAVADGQMDAGSTMDVHFDTNGSATVAPTYEPYSPLLISEVQPHALGNTDTPGPTNPSVDSEYIELYNPNGFAIPLSQYKIGDAATRGSTKTMLKFKSSNLTIPAKGVVVIAKYKTRFLTGWNQRHPGQTFPAPIYDETNDMTPYTQFASGTSLTLDNGPTAGQTTFKEQVVLLDENDGFADVVSYGNSATPFAGQVQINVPSVDAGVSFERCPAGIDTNGGFNPLLLPPTNIDFITRDTVDVQTPGVACVGRPGVDMRIEKVGPAVAQQGKPVQFTLNYSNVGSQPEPAGTVTIVDTLPQGLTFSNTAGNAVPMPTTVNGNVLTWVVPAPAVGGIAQSIVLTTTIGAVGESVPIINSAKISSQNEPVDPTIQANNQSSWTVTTVGPAKLNLALSGLSKALPGSTFGLTLDYSNTGADVAESTTITLTVPANVTLISSTQPDGVTRQTTLPANGPTTVTWKVDSPVAPGQTGSITVVGQVANNQALLGTTLPFSAGISSDSPTPVSATATGDLQVSQPRVLVPLIRR